MITDAQMRTYEFIRNHIYVHGRSPTLPEIATGIGIKSRGVVHRYVQALCEEGYLELIPRRHRGIRLRPQKAKVGEPIVIPVIGEISAGCPITSLNEPENINVTEMLSRTGLYVLKVNGDSMVNEGIFDGDLVLCEQRYDVKDGDIIVALIDRTDTTLKRMRFNDNQTVTLLPANTNYTPMVYDRSRIDVQGIFVGLLRLNLELS